MPNTTETHRLIGGPGDTYVIGLAGPTHEVQFLDDATGETHLYLREVVVLGGQAYGIWRWKQLPVDEATAIFTERLDPPFADV